MRVYLRSSKFLTPPLLRLNPEDTAMLASYGTVVYEVRGSRSLHEKLFSALE